MLKASFNQSCRSRPTVYDERFMIFIVGVRRCEQHRTTAVQNNCVIRLSVRSTVNAGLIGNREDRFCRDATLKEPHTRCSTVAFHSDDDLTRPRGCKTFSCSAEHEISTAH